MPDRSLAEALAHARLEVEPVAADTQGTRFFATNPQGLSARFTDEGAVLQSNNQGTWQARVRVSGLGRGEQAGALAEAATPGLQGRRVSYPRGMLTEWYENRPDGIEHGVTVHQRPAAGQEGRLRVDMEVSGLGVAATSGGLVLRDAAGKDAVSYHGLKVWDAQGRPLEATMQPAGQGMSILVADAGATYPVTIDPLFTSLEAKLTRTELECGRPQDYFGHSVAVLGDLVLVGCPGDDNLLGADAGGAYVFQRSGTEWKLAAKLKAADGKPGDRFGGSVALGSGFLLVGCRLADLPGKTDAGAVYMFTPKAGGWAQSAKLTARDASAGAWFGECLSIQGSQVLIGAPSADSGRGAAYHFQKSGATCVQRAVLKASDGLAGDGFGGAVAITEGRAVVGAPQRGSSAGAAYFFTQSGAVWQQTQVVTQPSALAGDFFGDAVAIDGTRAMAGAPGRGSATGAVYVYGFGATWTLASQLAPADAASGDRFGTALGLHRRTLLVGAPGDDLANPNQGSAYLFTSENGAPWTQQAKLVDDAGREDDLFGSHAAFDQTTAVVSAFQADTPGWNGQTVADLGAVHVFRVFASPDSSIAMRAAEAPSGAVALDEVLDLSVMDFGDVLVGQSSSNLLLVSSSPPPGRAEDIGGGAPVTSFLIENLGGKPLTGLRAQFSGTHAKQFTLARPLPSSLAPGGSFTLSIVFKPTSAGVKSANLRITSSDRSRPALNFPLSGTGVVIDPGSDPAVIVLSPFSQMVAVGQAVRFDSEATGSPTLGYQWRRGSQNLGGKTSRILGIRAALSSAGNYSVRAANRFGSDTSETATLWVVDTQTTQLAVLQGQRVTMKAVAAGPGLTYSWFFVPGGAGSVTPVSTGGRYTVSADGKSLTINNLEGADSGTYYCNVASSGFSLAGGRHELAVITSVPVFSDFSLPSGRITSPYSFQVPYSPVVTATPASFSASGLPPGLEINPTTGKITGVPTGAGNTTHMVTITARNAAGPATVVKPLYIEGLACEYIGTFTGLVERDGSANGGFGGQVVLTILPNASYTGTLNLGPQRLPFAGSFRYGGYSAGVSAVVSIPRPKPLGPVRFSFVVNSETRALAGTVSDGAAGPMEFRLLAGTPDVPGSTDGQAVLASFREPTGLAQDRAGNIYVADTANHVIRRISPTGDVVTFAGVAGLSGLANGCGEEVRFNRPTGVAVDSRGWLYVADSGNRVVRMITSEGKTTTLAGSSVPGILDGPGSTAAFITPHGVAMAADGGSVYVTDIGAHTVRRVTLAGVVSTVAGRPADEGARNGTGTAAQFFEPAGLAVFKSAADGEILVVADRGNHCLRKIVVKNRAVTTLAGAFAVPGDSDGSATNARFHRPSDVAVDAKGTFYVTDTGNAAVRRISTQGIVTTMTRPCDISGDHLRAYGEIWNYGEKWDDSCCGNEEVRPLFETLSGILWAGGRLVVTDSLQHVVAQGRQLSSCMVDVVALRNPWGNDSQPRSARVKATEGCYRPPATQFAGSYNFATMPCEENSRAVATVPQGSGIGSLTVRQDGTANWVLTLADGTNVTGSSSLGSASGGFYSYAYAGELPLFSMLYAGTGSVQGWLTIGRMQDNFAAPAAENPIAIKLVDGCLGWMKIPPATPTRNYGEGIRMHGMRVVGETATTANQDLVEQYFSGSTNNARLYFENGGLFPEVATTFTLAGNFAATMPGPDVTFSMNGTTLRFEGLFRLSHPNPVQGGQPAQVQRAPGYRGVFLHRLGRGLGYFLLEQLPSAGPPATTTTTSPIYSGSVVLTRRINEG